MSYTVVSSLALHPLFTFICVWVRVCVGVCVAVYFSRHRSGAVVSQSLPKLSTFTVCLSLSMLT